MSSNSEVQRQRGGQRRQSDEGMSDRDERDDHTERREADAQRDAVERGPSGRESRAHVAASMDPAHATPMSFSARDTAAQRPASGAAGRRRRHLPTRR
ncbi:MAG: hypothetical protein GEV06_00735 [Luteitalea sp.]|nr:hypothetical protein [Luteitalea sp.]